MAQTTDLTQRLDLDLLVVEDLLAELPQVAATWEELPPSHQAAWPLDWDQAMSVLRLLDEAHRRRQLTRGQRARYRALLARLKAVLPILDQLCLQRPPVPLDS